MMMILISSWLFQLALGWSFCWL